MRKIFWLIIWFLPLVAFSQEKATFSFNQKPLSEVLFFIEKTYNIRFSYSDKLLNDKYISLILKPRNLQETIVDVEQNASFLIEKISDRYYIVKEKSSRFSTTQFLQEVTISNYLTKGITKNKTNYFKIQPQKLNILPGLIEADVLESIQQLPGVVSPNETATGLVIRGGSLDQNRILWDGINIYHNGHLFGMISAFNPNIAKNIYFYNKGTNPKFGERVSSVIDIQTNQKIVKTTKASFSLNGINTDLVIETPLIKNRLSVQVSARRSYTDLLQTPTYKQLAKKVFQQTKITNNKDNDFYFEDYNAKINYHLNKNNQFAFSGIYISNKLNYFTSNSETQQLFNDVLSSKDEGLSLNWNKKWSNRMLQKTKLAASKYFFNYNLIEHQNTHFVNNFDKRNVIFDTDFSTSFTIKSKSNNSLLLGYQYNLKDVSYAFLNANSNLSVILDSDKRVVKTHSFFTNYSFKNKSIANINLGFRLNYYKEFNALRFEPRLTIYRNLFKNIKLQATAEVKNQIISQIDETVLSDLSLENSIWHLANNQSFPIINSKQVSMGLLYHKNGWSVDTDYYQKKINGVTALSLGFLNPDGKTFHIGKQNVKGLDVYLKKQFNNINLWLSYAYTDVQSNYKDLNDNNYFTSNTSITHSFKTSISYKIQQFQIALGWKWRTGKPYTKSYLDGNQLKFRGINTQNLPNYHRLDFSSTYQFKLTKKLKAKVGVSIRNLYNQKNQISREYYGYNDLSNTIKVQNKFGLGVTPNFVFKLNW